MNEIKNFYEFGNTTNPKNIVFLLHGLGSNGQDLISLAPYWAQGLPDTLFISPDAPFDCDMAPVGYQWFSLLSRDPENIQAGIEIAFPILTAFVKQQAERFGLSLSKTALVGFSQGSMMSLYTAPRLDEKIAGVVGYSGALFGEEGLLQDPDEFEKPPIRLIHGQADEVVSVSGYHNARDVLTKAGFDVSGHTTPGLGHSIDEAGVQSGAQFLQDIFQ
ncbi:MAG: phospholipase [Alphaproteobacteria bacterium]|nr:phospholipase [Alphaproteobacteria bacterium]|tara:strand:- start:618 stop:1271 length:654 start_codon:yes stop_codon:yes gene_type:complete